MEFFKNRTFALKGIIVHTPDFDHMEYHENEYVICKDGRSVGIFHELPEEYQEIPVLDFSDKFIIPGMCDMVSVVSECFWTAIPNGKPGLTAIHFQRKAGMQIWNMQTKLMAALLTIC